MGATSLLTLIMGTPHHGKSCADYPGTRENCPMTNPYETLEALARELALQGHLEFHEISLGRLVTFLIR